MNILYKIKKKKATLETIFDLKGGDEIIDLNIPDKILDTVYVKRVSSVEDYLVRDDVKFNITKLPKKLKRIFEGPYVVDEKFKVLSGNYKFGIINGVLLTIEKESSPVEEEKEVCVIPEGVKLIIDKAFDINRKVTVRPNTIILPSTIKVIGTNWFYHTLARKIIIPDSVKTIEFNAFSYNTRLEEIVLPKKMNSIGRSAFSKCINLKSIKIPNGIKEIPLFLFLECERLEEVILPEGLEVIKKNAFWGCKELRKLDIPNSVTQIGSSAFYSTSMIKEIKLPEKITTISNGLFWRSGIRKITIHKNIKRIEGSAFHKCFDLESVEFEEGCEEIASCVFSGCRSLKIIKLPKSIKKIERNAFCEISNLEIIYIPKTIAGIATMFNDYFYNCPNLEKIYLTEDESLYWEKNKNSQ